MGDATAIFSIHDQKDDEIHEVVQQVYDALKEKGYNPVNQLVGYILSEDPTYITSELPSVLSSPLSVWQRTF